MKNKILITGASGNLGGTVLDNLIKLLPPAQLVAAGRKQEAMARFAEKGVAVRAMDFDDAASIEQSLVDIGTIYLVPTGAHNRLEQHRRVVDIAARDGVKHLLYSGVIHHDESGFGPAISDHQNTERHMASTGLLHTFLRNGIYLDALPMLMGNAVESGTFAYPVAANGVSWAARADMAEATARIIANPALHGKIHNLCLLHALDYAEIAAIVSKVTGRTVKHVDLTPQAYEQVLVQVGIPAGLAGFLAGLADAMAKGVVLQPSDELKNILGREPVSAEQFLAGVFAAQVA
ncbi:MAG: NmrA family NAD(P)-binding protein [Flavobacteriales bacterium]|nr:NmrA family NAD(P)-binding protein [Flavobacteriales bacterium]